jgi:hypothetical protein
MKQQLQMVEFGVAGLAEVRTLGGTGGGRSVDEWGSGREPEVML